MDQSYNLTSLRGLTISQAQDGIVSLLARLWSQGDENY